MKEKRKTRRVVMRGRSRGAPILVVIALVLCGCQSIPSGGDRRDVPRYAEVRQELEELIPKLMRKNDVVGLSVALIDDQEIVWAEGFGYADEAAEAPATEETVYRVASISKLFTSTAVMQLAEAGLIDIDQPFVNCVPDFSIKTRFADADPITPRNLLTHHSGLFSYLQNGEWTRDPETLAEETARLREEYTVYPPNFIYNYSNVGMALLGRMIEVVSGTDFAAHMAENILGPMAMNHSSFTLTDEIRPLLSKGYSGGEEREQFPYRDLPAGGLYSNVLDLSRFLQMVFADGRSGGNRIASPETLETMLSPQNEDVALDLGRTVGLGWALPTIRGVAPETVSIAGHSGGSPLFSSQLLCIPESKIGVVVLINSSEGGNMKMEVATRALKLMYEAKTGTKVKLPEAAASSRRVSVSPEVLEKHTGTYKTAFGFTEFKLIRGKLTCKLMGQTMQLMPQSDGTFGLRALLLGLIPVTPAELRGKNVSFERLSGYDLLILDDRGERTLIGTRADPVPIPEAWQQCLGRYANPDPGEAGRYLEFVELHISNGFLMVDAMHHDLASGGRGVSRRLLKPLSDTEAVVWHFGDYGDALVVARGDDGEWVHFAGYTFRRSVP